MTKLKLSGIATFVDKYADEALSVGTALSALLEGSGISPSLAAEVRNAVSLLTTAHANIKDAVKSGAVDATPVKISKADVAAAVKDALPEMLHAAVAAELAKQQLAVQSQDN